MWSDVNSEKMKIYLTFTNSDIRKYEIKLK